MIKSNVSVVVTGIDWMGGGVGSIESAIQQLFQEAEQEILLTVYALTNGADMLFEWLEMALIRGVEIKMAINRIDEKTADVRAQLIQLADLYPHFYLCNFTSDDQIDLHAKLIVVDRRKAIVGSSNLSRRGLLTNYELAVLIEGPTATEIANVVDRLLSRLY
ncbi:MAG: endonuclease [Ardenticatenales bacterium]|nr:endonuclease [Ardenticatenales bacterium]